ncbi:DUF2163 domain-containing protein [Mesorhizobium microcysteis]|uniref:DUF2163 domain-containing protein n=1 Tax=Neoaquamicrobium microcysteis TaxID=2682781 RepID=A0A5D4H4B0_9HYPH|nr:DUF2163 domain-containing protein [Mesorhizobium microcysteis]TYR34285.1 DUF2163 domain-containing protein [Mesorhizobium microcysteis]
MSAYSPAFRAHLESECTTLCHCWRVTRRDGQSFGFTDHDRALTVDGFAYEPQSGFATSEARASLGMAADAVDVEGALSSDVIAEDDIAGGLFDGATVQTLLVNWQTPAQFASIRRAVIGKIVRTDGRFVAELESVAASLDRPNGRYLRRTCDARLGDARCGVNMSAGALNGRGAVVQQTAPATIRVSGLGGFAAGWFSFGEISWTGGALQGRSAIVVDHRIASEGVLIALPADEAMPGPGDTFSIVAGCDKQFATCKAKFSNPVNFRGFPHLPGNDAAYGYVTGGGQFDGGPIVE